MDVHLVQNLSAQFIMEYLEALSGEFFFTSNNFENEDCEFFIIVVKEGEKAVISCEDNWKNA